MKAKKVIVGIAITTIVLVGGGVLLYNQYIDNQVTALSELIHSNIDSLNELEADQYFPTELVKEVDSLNENIETDIKQRNISELEKTEKKSSEINRIASEKIKETDNLYLSLQNLISRSESLFSNYFSKDFDLDKLETEYKNAKKVIEAKDFTNYKKTEKALVAQVKLFEEKFKEKTKNIISQQTDFSEEYPFAVDMSKYSDDYQWSFDPIRKQSSINPSWIVKNPAEYTDKKGTFAVFFEGSSFTYYYTISNVPTKEILVEAEDGNHRTALVNTVLNLKHQGDYMNEEIRLVERPMYLFYNENNNLTLAVQDFDGKDLFLLYQGSM